MTVALHAERRSGEDETATFMASGNASDDAPENASDIDRRSRDGRNHLRVSAVVAVMRANSILRSMLVAASISCLVALGAIAEEGSYAPPPPPTDASKFGRNYQRTMTLLATSTPERRHKVKILFYGQSIAAGTWWKQVAADLHTRFPHADLEVENRAIGGFSVRKLYRVAEHDVHPYYPDLMIFHAYGSDRVYEDLIAEIRRRTATEIAIWTDHLGAREKPGIFGSFRDRGWPRYMAGFLRAVASEYDLGFIEIREPWKRYVLENDLDAQALLLDDIHLNDQGGALIARLIERELVYRPDLGLGPSSGLVAEYEIGSDVKWTGGRLELAFEGNRVDLIPEAVAGPRGSVEIRIDGKRPSEYPGVYAHMRPSQGYPKHGPGILRVGFDEQLLVEDWLVRVTHVDDASGTFRFEVIGSKTGHDGVGVSDEDFRSTSGRVVIRAHVRPRGLDVQSDWRMSGEIPVGYEIRWSTIGLFLDRYTPPVVSDTTRDHAATVAQGFPNGNHTLTLSAEGEARPAIRAIRVYRPPVARGRPNPSRSVATQAPGQMP